MARLPAHRRTEVGGWIVVPGADGYHVYFHGKGDAADSIVYEADVIGNQVSNAVVRPRDGGPRLPAPASAMAKALRIAWSDLATHPDWQPCTNARFNTVVLPPQGDGSIPVYFLTPQTRTDNFPFGGHFEIVITADGDVASSRRFTNACLNMDKAQASATMKPGEMYLTHLLDAQPTEIHVFQQFAIGMPLHVGIVSTNAIWKVENGIISLERAPK